MMLKGGDKTAIISGDSAVSYDELLHRINMFSKLIHIRTGDRVAILSENRPEWIYAFYAIWLKEGIAVPMDFMSPSSDTRAMLEDSTPAVVFTSRNCLTVLDSAVKKIRKRPRIIVFEDMTTIPCPPLESLRIRDLHATAAILYTSGTTGNAKGVMLSFDNLLASIESITGLGMLTAEDRMLAILPFHHIFPLQGTVLCPLYMGATIAFARSLNPEDILATLKRHKITMFLGVPRLYDAFHASLMMKIRASIPAMVLFRISRYIDNLTLSGILFRKVQNAFGGNIHAYLTGGAPLLKNTARDLRALGFKLVEGYGLTETAPLISFNRFDRIKPGSVGLPMPNTEVRIIDGEIAVRGRNVMKGYYKKPAATARVMRDGWFFTGDVGSIDGDGFITVSGRKDEMIVLASGKNINPEEIEIRLKALTPLIADIAVLLRDGQLTALINPSLVYAKKRGISNIQEMIKWKAIDRYNLSVPPYRRILNIALTNRELPRTRLGKLRRHLLKDYFSSGSIKRSAISEPEFEEYRLLKNFLGRLTGLAVHPDDHFEMDLGMDSLNKIELMTYCETIFGLKLSEMDLASNANPKKLAEIIRLRKTRMASGELVNWELILAEGEEVGLPAPRLLVPAVLRGLLLPVVRILFRLKHNGIETLPDIPFIIAPNHQSYLDAFLLMLVMPRRILKETFFIANSKHLITRIAGTLSRNIIIINFEKDLKAAMHMTAAVLKNGKNVVIFPEGTRSRDGRLGAFKKTFAILSKELNVPVVPLAISGAFESFPFGRMLPRPGNIRLHFAEPVYPGKEDYQSIMNRVRSIIDGLLLKQ
ncbi:MAG: AMP-binding protein [Spirochaetota bacterium]